jgi:tetraacyldisaccharide 4'-kinase
MRLFDPVLYPFALLYDGITRLRNRMFDIGSKKSVVFEIPTIVVGNLALGGTGKTPMVEFLIEKLADQHELATLSRGYGRKTTGVILAGGETTPEQIGDEPYQIYHKYGSKVHVAVGEQRILAIPQIIMEYPSTEVVLLDDAFQHRYVKGDFNILLTTYQKPFFEDKVVPMGTLRENMKGAGRADVVVVTKCPGDISPETKMEFRQRIGKYAGQHCPVLFAGLKYGEPYDVSFGGKAFQPKIVLITGIANSRVLVDHVAKEYQLKATLDFPDHYKYTVRDVEKIVDVFGKYSAENCVILTTEKDMVKLKDVKFKQMLKEIPIFALPVQVAFEHEEENLLLELILQSIREKDYIREV